MRKLIIKGMWTMLGAAGLVLASSSAALADDSVVATVPFDFIVSGVHMPAGRYVVTQLDGQALVSVAGADRNHFAFVLSNPLDESKTSDNAKLVFDRVGSNSYLARVVAGMGEGREILVPSKLLKGEPTRVAVAAFPTTARKITH
jgi:hypothetical protein